MLEPEAHVVDKLTVRCRMAYRSDLHTPIPAVRIAFKPAGAHGQWRSHIRRLGTCPGCVADRRENQRRHIAEWRAANPETARATTRRAAAAHRARKAAAS